MALQREVVVEVDERQEGERKIRAEEALVVPKAAGVKDEAFDGGSVQLLHRMAQMLERMEQRNAREDAKQDGGSVLRLAGGESGVK